MPQWCNLSRKHRADSMSELNSPDAKQRLRFGQWAEETSAMGYGSQLLPRHLIACAKSLARGFFFAALCAAVTGQTLLGVLSINGTVEGTTIGASTGVFDSFATVGIGGAGQVYYTLDIPGEEKWDVTFSTCLAASFDTYIVVFSRNAPAAANILAESNNDESCTADPRRSKTKVVLEPGQYSILVTGVGLAQGTFKLETSAQLPSSVAIVPWGLDRIDQRKLPVDGKYKVPMHGDNGAGITVYVLDSGVRSTHEEFEGRVTEGFDFVTHSTSVKDCTGFGTSAAAVIAGKTYGVAKAAKIVSVRILDCENRAKASHVTSALEWVILNVQHQRSRQVPAIIFMRFHSGQNDEVDKAVASTTKFGIPVIAPAGDGASGTFCSETSPATSKSAIMVGSTDDDDYRSSFSNYGGCIDLFAPGNNITSASFKSDTAIEASSGTAISAAHVAGAAALLLDMNARVSPKDLGSILTSLGTVDVVKNGTGMEVGESAGKSEYPSPRLTFVRSIPDIFGDRATGDAPLAKTIFVYFMVNFTELTGSSTDECSATALKSKMLNVVGVEDSDLISFCARESAVYRVTAGERKAAPLSYRVSSALDENRPATEKALGAKFTVVEEPWFVDSQRFVYWSEPQFPKSDKSLLTAGAIAGIVVGALLVVVILGVLGYASFRHINGVDDIESMEGSADFERGPTHFNDFAGNNGAPRESNAMLVARSFRNVFDGIGKSLSMRGGGGLSRQGSRRGGGESESSGGISRMDSYMGQVRGADQGGGTDIMRMKSYGGEAFAGLGAVSRSNSVRSVDSITGGRKVGAGGGFNEDQRLASFRGSGILGISSSRQNSALGLERMESEAGDSVSDVRMHSIGGEAFAMLTRELSEAGVGHSHRPRKGHGPPKGCASKPGAPGSSASQPNNVTTENDSYGTQMRTESYGAEALAPVSVQPSREPSSFNSNGRR
jgi:hypothetical protein